MTAESSGLGKMQRYTTQQRVFIVEQYLKRSVSPCLQNSISATTEA